MCNVYLDPILWHRQFNQFQRSQIGLHYLVCFVCCLPTTSVTHEGTRWSSNGIMWVRSVTKAPAHNVSTYFPYFNSFDLSIVDAFAWLEIPLGCTLEIRLNIIGISETEFIKNLVCQVKGETGYVNLEYFRVLCPYERLIIQNILCLPSTALHILD